MSGLATASLLPEAPRRRHEEADLQRAVHRFLTWALPSDAVHFAIPNGLMRSKKAAARAQGEGVLAGVPDIEVIYRGRCFFIELKAAHGRMSAAQRAMMRKLSYCDAPVMLCRSLEEVEAQLREACIPLQATVSGWMGERLA